MSYYGEVYIAEQTMHRRVEERLRQAREEQQQQEWLSRLGGRMLGQLGHLLVTVGQRLKQYNLQPLPLQGQMSSGS